jgi:hypothetical protein
MTQSSATQRGSRQANAQFNTDRTHPGRWTITFSNPPINMFVPSTIVELGALMTDLDEADPSVKVVVFQSANPDFFHRPSRRSQGSRTARGAGPLARVCAAPLVHASREHRQDSRPHARHR